LTQRLEVGQSGVGNNSRIAHWSAAVIKRILADLEQRAASSALDFSAPSGYLY
jgi:hypothetical protein